MGNCRQATTWHKRRDGGDHGGKQYQGSLGKRVHVKVMWSDDASKSNVSVAGHLWSNEGFADVMTKYGLKIYSSHGKDGCQVIVEEMAIWTHPVTGWRISQL